MPAARGLANFALLCECIVDRIEAIWALPTTGNPRSAQRANDTPHANAGRRRRKLVAIADLQSWVEVRLGDYVGVVLESDIVCIVLRVFGESAAHKRTNHMPRTGGRSFGVLAYAESLKIQCRWAPRCRWAPERRRGGAAGGHVGGGGGCGDGHGNGGGAGGGGVGGGVGGDGGGGGGTRSGGGGARSCGGGGSGVDGGVEVVAIAIVSARGLVEDVWISLYRHPKCRGIFVAPEGNGAEVGA